MDELVPIVLGAALGALIWVATTGRGRIVLGLGAVLASGFVATVSSGEYQESWIYLLLDFGEAALGLAAGLLIGSRVQRARAAAHARASAKTRQQS